MRTATVKVVNFSGYYSKNQKSNYTEVKPIKEMSSQQMKAANSFKRRDRERD